MIYIVWVQYFFKSFFSFFLFDIDLLGYNLCDLFSFSFYRVIIISYLRSQVSRVNMGWLSFFLNWFFIWFYPLSLNYQPSSVVIFSPFFTRGYPGWSSISTSPPRISGVSSSMVTGVARVAFCFLFFFLLSYLIFMLAFKKKIKSTPRVCYT
jgi:hypothetical protein